MKFPDFSLTFPVGARMDERDTEGFELRRISANVKPRSGQRDGIYGGVHLPVKEVRGCDPEQKF